MSASSSQQTPPALLAEEERSDSVHVRHRRGRPRLRCRRRYHHLRRAAALVRDRPLQQQQTLRQAGPRK